MSTELLNVLESIEREKGISRKVLIESVEAALVSAAKKVIHDKDKEVEVKIDVESGKIRIFSDGKEIVSNEFGRIAAQTAKQVIFQKIREAERDVIFNEFQEKGGSIVSGTVYRFEKGALLVDLGKTEGILPKREISPRDSYRQGDTIRAYVLEVNKTAKGPQILLSRNHPGFVKCLFELEVPEVADGMVEIRAASRGPGDRVKITNQAEKKVEVVVGDDQLSLAIGKNGQNVRLASKLTGWSIDIRSKKDIANEKLEAQLAAETPPAAEEAATSEAATIESLEGVGPKTAEAMAAAGFKTVADLKKASKEELLAVKGIG